MIRKGLTKTLINEFIAANNLADIQQILDNSADLYRFLKQHPLEPLTGSLNYDKFMTEMMTGVQIAQMKNMFRR